jgi:hypothetical protein
VNRNLRLLWTILTSLQSLPLAVSISQTSWIMDFCIKFLEIPLAMTLLDLKKFWAFCTTAVYDLGAFDVYLCFWTPFAPSSIQGIQGVTALEQILIVVHQSMFIDCVNPNVAQIFVENLASTKPTKNTSWP